MENLFVKYKIYFIINMRSVVKNERSLDMEYISSFTYCDTIQTEMTPQGPQQQIVKPLQALTPIAIPGNFSFAIACSIAGFDTSKENSVKIMFLDPSNNVLYDTGDVNFQLPTEQIKPSGIASMQFNIDIRNLVFREAGLHSTKVIFNNIELGEYKIQVIEVNNDDGDKPNTWNCNRRRTVCKFIDIGKQRFNS